MSGLVWGPTEEARLAAIRDDLASVSTATACQLLIALGWRNAYMRDLLPLAGVGAGHPSCGPCPHLPLPDDDAAQRVRMTPWPAGSRRRSS